VTKKSPLKKEETPVAIERQEPGGGVWTGVTERSEIVKKSSSPKSWSAIRDKKQMQKKGRLSEAKAQTARKGERSHTSEKTAYKKNTWELRPSRVTEGRVRRRGKGGGAAYRDRPEGSEKRKNEGRR